MTGEELLRAVNVRETVKMYAIYLGIYDEFVRAYVMTGEGMCRHYCNPGLHESFERKSGAARAAKKAAVTTARNSGRFANKEEFIQWAVDNGLDPDDAGECWEATEERGGKDADGNTVKNMKAFARQWCRTRANNRRTA